MKNLFLVAALASLVAAVPIADLPKSQASPVQRRFDQVNNRRLAVVDPEVDTDDEDSVLPLERRDRDITHISEIEQPSDVTVDRSHPTRPPMSQGGHQDEMIDNEDDQTSSLRRKRDTRLDLATTEPLSDVVRRGLLADSDEDEVVGDIESRDMPCQEAWWKCYPPLSKEVIPSEDKSE